MMLLLKILFLLIGTGFLTIIFVKSATEKDYLLYRNKRTRRKVAVDIRQSMTKEEIKQLFFKQNIWEIRFFWFGFLYGIVSLIVLVLI